MAIPEFMSPDHVAQMNELLARSPAVQAAAASLGGDHTMTYQLHNAPSGVEYWTIEVSPRGLRFVLGPPTSPSDVTVSADWAATMRSAQAQRDGAEETPVGSEVSGDPEVLTRLQPVIEVARTVATVDSRIPSV